MNEAGHYRTEVRAKRIESALKVGWDMVNGSRIRRGVFTGSGLT